MLSEHKSEPVRSDYREAGSGIPIIFIPGITETKESFAFQFMGLHTEYRIISYDVRRGLKRASDYTLELLSSDLEKVMTAADVRSAVICGHSFGGLIALQFALTHPEKTSALILVSAFPAAPPAPKERLLEWMSSANHPFHKSLGAKLRLQMSRILSKESIGTLSLEQEVSAIRDIAKKASEVPKTTISQRMHIIEQAGFRLSLPEIAAPTLVVAGSKDRAAFLSCAQELHENIPDSSLEVIEGGGHFCFMTKHDEFNSAVDEFISRRHADIT